MPAGFQKELKRHPTQSSIVGYTENTKIAVIGGTGLDEIAAPNSTEALTVRTRFGRAVLVPCTVSGIRYWFLPRHGPNHDTPPHAINYRAQIAALKTVGVKRILAVCCVGSLVREIPPGSLVGLTDFIDFTRGRLDTFCEANSRVWHTDFTHPYCVHLTQALLDSCSELGIGCTPAVYVGVSGPRYETPAEVRLYSSWGGHVVGMTNVPEAILAREAGLCYAALGVVTNYAAGLSAGTQSHADVRKSFSIQSKTVIQVISLMLGRMAASEQCSCHQQSCLD